MAWVDQYELMVYCDTHYDNIPEESLFNDKTVSEEFVGTNKRDVFRQVKKSGWMLDYLADGTPRARCPACVARQPVLHPSRQKEEQGEQE